MKTITIDFKLYQEELLAERRRGFEIVKDLKLRIGVALKAMRGGSSDEYHQAVRQLAQIDYDLERPLTAVAKSQGDE